MISSTLTTRCVRHVLCGRRVELSNQSRKWRTKRFGNIKWRVSAVSYKVVHTRNQREGGWEFLNNTSVWSANKGPWRADGRRGGYHPFNRGRRKKRVSKTFQRERPWKKMPPLKGSGESAFGVRGFGRTSQSKLLV